MLTLTENGPDAQVAGSTLFYNPTAGSVGSVTVAASTSDAESGIAQVAFPAVFGSDGVSMTTSRPTRRTTAGVREPGLRGANGHRHQRGGLDRQQQLHRHPRQRRAEGWR